MSFRHIIGLGCLLLLAACEKEIGIDYHQVEPLYVVEATINQTQTTARVTTTMDMTDETGRSSVVENATVVLTVDGQVADTLRYDEDGNYTSAMRGRPGTTYGIEVSVGNRRFTSSSTMQRTPQMGSFRFVWKKVLTEKMLFAELKLQSYPSAPDYYFMHIYRNDIGYRWAVIRSNEGSRWGTTDEDEPYDGELQQLFMCTTEREMKEGTATDLLRDGDAIRVDIRAIDRRTYDYFYSMQHMDNTSTNPIDNFEGGCLGYFSAYYGITHQQTFRLSKVEEE